MHFHNFRITTSTYRLILNISCLLFICIFQTNDILAQPNTQIADSTKIAQNNRDIQAFLFRNQYDKAITSAEANLKVVEATNYEREKSKTFLYLGKAFRQKKNHFESLKNLLKALRICENLYDNEAMAEVITEIGRLFQQQKAYVKASEYFNNAYNLYKKTNQIEKANQVLANLAQIDFLLGDRQNAYKNFVTLLEVRRQEMDTLQTILVLNKMTDIEVAQGDFQSATQHYLELAKFYNKPASIATLSAIYNNLGFAFKRQNNVQQSMEYFNKSLGLFQKNIQTLPDSSYAMLLENIGVAYANLSAYENAEEFFKNALRIKQQVGNKAEIAKTYNYISANDYISGNEAKALENVNQAINVANAVGAEEVLVTSYKILALIYKNDNATKSQEYSEQAKRIGANLEDKQEFEMQKTLNNNSYLEKLENDLKQQILIDEQNSARFRRLTEESALQLLENAKREDELKIRIQQIELLRKEQKIREIALNNEQLESDKTVQMLTSLREKTNYEQQRLRLELQVQSQKAQEEQQKLVIDQQTRKIEDANRLQERGIIIIILGSLFFIAVAISFYFSYRNNRELRKKNLKIAEQSNDIAQKNMVLDLQNTKISESIRAAQTIQHAILPKDELFAHLFTDFFVFFRPKDLVSGDFYWIDRINDKIIIASVDCTGHGVPGAFMSMIGNSLLDKITEKLHILSPEIILDMLDQEINTILSQSSKLGNEVGMDIAICVIHKQAESQSYKVSFAGAGQSMYYAIPTYANLVEIKGDTKSIGVAARKKVDFNYTQKEVFLDKGSSIYLFSDGFPDQNNAEKQKIGTRRLKELLAQNINLPMQKQKEYLSQFLTNFQKEEPQRDDITVLGVRL
jgi:serine phosphatase RsbU (regulator of sigma subunit)